MNITSRPLQWPCHNVSCECTFEKRISVGSVRRDGVRVDATLRTFRTDAFTPKPWAQELPAVYTNAPYHRLITYNGSAPYTRAATAEYNMISGPSIARGFPATEHWAAYVNDDGYGIGIVNLATSIFHANFYGGPDFSNQSMSTGYVSPVTDMVLEAQGVYEFTFHLVLGTVSSIRSYAYQVAGYSA